MNPIEKTMRRVDAAQQRFGPAALVFGVVKKFGDDNAGNLVTNLAYSAFLCVFPLLLILITVLNIVLVNYPSVRHSLLNSTWANSLSSGPRWKATSTGCIGVRP